MAVLLIALAVVLNIVLTKGSDKNKKIPIPLPDIPSIRTDSYLTAKYEVKKDQLNVKIHSIFSQLPLYINYTDAIVSVAINDISVALNKGNYKFMKEGNYTVDIFFNGSYY